MNRHERRRVRAPRRKQAITGLAFLTAASLATLYGQVLRPRGAYGATISCQVTSNQDTGAGTLRSCMTTIQANADGGTITFDTSAMGSSTITLTSKLPTLTKNTTIDGGGAVTITGYPAPVFDPNSSFGGKTLTLDGLTFSGLYGKTALFFETGGVASSTINIVDSTITSNSTSYSPVYLKGGTDWHLNITNSTFSGNSATDSAGAIMMDGTLTVSGSTFNGNKSTGSSEEGGAIYLTALGNSTITASTFINNYSSFGSYSGKGGAIYAIPYSGSPTLTVTNTYIGRNKAHVAGAIASKMNLTLNFSTISGNYSLTSGGDVTMYTGDPVTLTVKGTAINSPGNPCYIPGTTTKVLSYAFATGSSCGFNDPSSHSAEYPPSTQLQLGSSTTTVVNGVTQTSRPPLWYGVLVANAPTSALGTGITVDQIGVARSGTFAIGSRQIVAPTYTVTFDANGGSGSMSSQSASSSTALTANAFTRLGYTFAGWNTASNGSGTAYANGAAYPFSSDTTLYAQWTVAPTYTVTFDANGGSGSMASQSASSSTALTANAFTRSGFTFAGWNTASNGSGTAYANGAAYPFSSSTTLYAQWTAGGGGGGGGGGSTAEPTSAATTAPPAAPSKPSTTASLDPITNPANPNVPTGGLPAGSSLLLVNGQPTQVTLTPNAPRDATGLDAAGDGWAMKLAGRGDDGDPLGLTDKQVLVLQSEQLARAGFRAATKVNPVAVASGVGFRANTPVKFYLLPATYLGQLTTDSAGSFAGSVPVPAGIAPGNYTLQTNALAPSGAVRSLSIGVIVKPARVVTSTVRASVRFKPLSATLSPSAKAQLREVANQAKQGTQKSVVVGYVQPTQSTGNDQALSISRAKAVAAFLRSRGVKGVYLVRGGGRAAETGAKARRVDVAITYQV